MPRPRLPTELHELKGSYKKNPQRARGRTEEPIPKGSIGKPPVHLFPEARVVWQQTVAQAAPGVFKRSDRLLLECICYATLRVRQPDCCAADLAQLKSLLQQAGMTPASRSLVQVPHEENGNEFAKAAAAAAAARARAATGTG